MRADAPMQKKPFSLLNGLKGVAIGMANIVPGVSGGTVAAITGLYDELVDALGNFFGGEGGWKRNLAFLAPVIVGVLVGNVVLARGIGFLLEAAPGPARFGFMGLVLGSLPYLWRRSGISRVRLRHLLLFSAGVALVLWMGLAQPPDASPPLTELTPTAGLLVFGAAFLSGIAMAIPGVSGSFLLLLVGMYSTLQHGFSTLNLPVMALFTVGTLAGAILFAKAAAALLRRFHAASYAVIIGLVAGSAVALFPGWGSGAQASAGVALFVLGFGLSYFLGGGRKEHLSTPAGIVPKNRRNTMVWIGLAVVVLGLYVAAGLRRPAEKRTFFTTLPVARPLVIAHRGGQYIFPENTLAAFKGAAELGVDALEMDVHRTADGVPVVIHDETVDRTTDGTGRVDQLTLTELKRLDAGYRFAPPGRDGEHPFRGTGVDIPTLREVFEALPHLPMIVEVKENDPELADAVIALIREFDRADRTMPASFHHDLLVRFRTVCPDAVTHASEREVVRFVVAAWFGLEGLIDPAYEAIMVPPRKGILPVASRRVLRAARKRNLFTAVWSVEDPAEMRLLAARGVDALTTGRPDLAVEVRQK